MRDLELLEINGLKICIGYLGKIQDYDWFQFHRINGLVSNFTVLSAGTYEKTKANAIKLFLNSIDMK